MKNLLPMLYSNKGMITQHAYSLQSKDMESESDRLKNDVFFLRLHQPSTSRLLSMKDPIN